MAILTKSDILQGINDPKKVEIEALNGELWLRPLSSAEIDEITNIEAQGYGTFNASSRQKNTVAEGKMNLPKMQEKSNEAKYAAIHKSINNDKYDEEWTLTVIIFEEQGYKLATLQSELTIPQELFLYYGWEWLHKEREKQAKKG